ncbi:hypothetical protein GGR56DRAFT_316956 [Xylariaceae sp. FL0804]|nr:hypothetical protein GGR56DRAFT_316956 [Xylariaceae sp. FL0804]
MTRSNRAWILQILFSSAIQTLSRNPRTRRYRWSQGPCDQVHDLHDSVGRERLEMGDGRYRHPSPFATISAATQPTDGSTAGTSRGALTPSTPLTPSIWADWWLAPPSVTGPSADSGPSPAVDPVLSPSSTLPSLWVCCISAATGKLQPHEPRVLLPLASCCL